MRVTALHRGSYAVEIERRLVDRTDPATQLVARRMIELAQQGERDPIRLREGAIKGI
jgi:hypothetical protein